MVLVYTYILNTGCSITPSGLLDLLYTNIVEDQLVVVPPKVFHYTEDHSLTAP